jgi:predicted AlkP superfamily pyrophosphatase or phosphodiesterase
MNGYFKQKHNLDIHSPPSEVASQSKRKVILLLFDALREDFVEFDDGVERYLPLDRVGAYTGRRIKLFKESRTHAPDHSLLFPFKSEMPTVTTVRIKGMLTGGITNFFETSEEFVSTECKEDNLLYQIQNRAGKPGTTVFYGDYIWTPMFGKYFDERSEDFESLNVRDLDTHDKGVVENVYRELDSGSDFTLMLVHIIGVDSAGHTYDA